jgi:hypothetical protein
MDASEAKRLKQLEEENAKLKKLLAEQMRDAAALRELPRKKMVGPTEVGVKDRGRLRGDFWHRLPIKLVVEDGFDRAVGPGTDFDGALGSFETCDAEGTGEAEDAQTQAR